MFFVVKNHYKSICKDILFWAKSGVYLCIMVYDDRGAQLANKTKIHHISNLKQSC